MLNKFGLFTISALFSLNVACGSSTHTNNNAVLNQNTNSPVNASPADAAVSPTPLPPAANVASSTGDDSTAVTAAKTSDPPPASKNANAANQRLKPAATPANNIPDAETLRRQMQRPASNSNVAGDPNDGMMRKRSNSNGGSMMKRSSNINSSNVNQ